MVETVSSAPQAVRVARDLLTLALEMEGERREALLAAARGTTVVLEGDPMLQGGAWLGLLLAFNAIHWSLSGLLFGRVLEDG